MMPEKPREFPHILQVGLSLITWLMKVVVVYSAVAVVAFFGAMLILLSVFTTIIWLDEPPQKRVVITKEGRMRQECQAIASRGGSSHTLPYDSAGRLPHQSGWGPGIPVYSPPRTDWKVYDECLKEKGLNP